MTTQEFWIGTYADEGHESLFRVTLNRETGALTQVWSDARTVNPSWVLPHPDGHLLYTVEEEVPDGRIAVLARSGGDWRLARRLPAGSAPCHLALDPEGSLLYASNYMDGTLSVYALDADGLPVREVQRIRHSGHGVNPERQEGPHIHSALPVGDRVYVADLGLDRLFAYRLDRAAARLEKEREIALPAGCGPRHTCPVPGQPDQLFLLAELSGQLFRLNRLTGELLQTAAAVPEDFRDPFRASSVKTCGRTLYTGAREADCVALFALDAAGVIGERAIHRLTEQTPRDVWMDTDWCITADEGSCGLTLLRREGLRLERTAFLSLGEAKPTCIVPVRGT